MAGPRKWTEEIIARREKEGRGRGTGDSYMPWIYVEEFSSKGTQTRVAPGKLRRTVHTMSYLEMAMFAIQEFKPNFVGYREQFPLSRELTLGAAKTLRIRHPVYPNTGVPVVMTIDAIVTERLPDGRLVDIAWDAKPERMLAKKRVREKLSLHTAYSNYSRLEHRLFTEKTAPPNLAKNLLWARAASHTPGEILCVTDLFTFHYQRMLDELAQHKFKFSIQKYCTAYDQKFDFPPGTALRLFRHLIWRHEVRVDLTAQEIPKLTLPAPQRTLFTTPLGRAA